jgi:hypothetical protein
MTSIKKLNQMIAEIEDDPATMSKHALNTSSGVRFMPPAVRKKIQDAVLKSRDQAGDSIRTRWADPVFKEERKRAMKNNNTKYPTPEEVKRYRKALKLVEGGMPVKHASDKMTVKYERLRLYLRGERLEDLK